MRKWKRRRHSYDRGLPCGFPRQTLRELLKKSTWKRHPAPFAKTRRGHERRAARLFVIEMQGVELCI